MLVIEGICIRINYLLLYESFVWVEFYILGICLVLIVYIKRGL